MLKCRIIKNGGHILTLILLLGVFLLLFSEDRQFKQWNETYQHSFHWFFDMEYWCRYRLSPNDRILVDMSGLRGILQPFQSTPFGTLRLRIYRRLAPGMIKHINYVQHRNAPFWVFRLRENGRFHFMSPGIFPGIDGLQVHDSRAVHRFRQSQQIDYFVCPFTDWHKKKAEWENLGYRLIYNNLVFMIFQFQKDDLLN